MDVTTVSEAVARLLAAGGVKELGEAAGGDLMAGILARVRAVFGSDARSVDALEQARRQGTEAAVAELTAALSWYARRDTEFGRQLAAWVAQAGAGGVAHSVASGPIEEQAIHTEAIRRAPEMEQFHSGLHDPRGGSASAFDPRLEGIRYDELRYDDPAYDDEPSHGGLGYDQPLDDASWYEELRRNAPAYPERPSGQPTGEQRRGDLRRPRYGQQSGVGSETGQHGPELPQVRDGKSESIPGEVPPESTLAAPSAAPGISPGPAVRLGHGLDGPEITESWPPDEPRADDQEPFDDFWQEGDEEYRDLFAKETRRRPTYSEAAARRFAKVVGILGRGRHRRRPRGSVPQGNMTPTDVPQGGGPRVRAGKPQGMPGQATPETTSAKTAPGGPIVPSTPAERVELPVPEQRFLQGRFPERVRLGEEVSLLVRLGLRPGGRLEAGLRPVRVPEAGLKVVLLLVDSPGFMLRSPERAVVQVIPRQDSDWASFELQAALEGVHTLQVEAFAGGSGLGGLPIQVSVDAATQTGPLMERSSPAGAAVADPGEVSLLLSYDADQHVYRYRLVDSGGYYSEEAASDRLLQPPGQAIEQLVNQLNALARGQEAWDAATTKDWLKGQGITLWNSFIPQALQREFWRRQDRITQMTIISQGDPVPWELLYPFAPGDQDAGFLVDQFPVARRRYGPRPPSRLELGVADLVLSRDGSLTSAPVEIAALDGLLRGRGLAARHIDDLPTLLQAFRQGDVGLLHFSCHNAFARGAPNTSRILLGDQPFEPVFLEQHAGRFAAPLVFLNACRTDGQAPLYTTVEGWASSFIRAGAGAFIGSLWEVSDISASIYAQVFYQAALTINCGSY